MCVCGGGGGGGGGGGATRVSLGLRDSHMNSGISSSSIRPWFPCRKIPAVQ